MAAEGKASRLPRLKALWALVEAGYLPPDKLWKYGSYVRISAVYRPWIYEAHGNCNWRSQSRARVPRAQLLIRQAVQTRLPSTSVSFDTY
jgi:hypothetical protein